MPPRPPGSHALAFVLVTVLIDMIGIGIILPVLPAMIGSLAGVQVSGASTIGGWLMVSYAAMQFLCGPLLGNLSDAYGRRPVLLLSVAGLGIDYALTAFAPSIAWLFVGRLVAGLFGASYSTANAYIADITAPAERGKAFGMIGAAFGVGFVIGPAIGGLLGEFGPRVPFLFAAGLSLLNLAYGWLVLPETLPPERRRPFSLSRANPAGALVALSRHPVVLSFAAVLVLHFLATSAYPAVWAYYTIERYGWTEWQVGLSLATYGIVTAVVQGGLVGPLIRRFGEWRAAVIALSVEAGVAFAYAAATQGWMIYVLLVAGALQNIAMPAINAMMSQRVGPDEQGELQGAVSGLSGITSIVGPLVATQLFGAFTGPAAPVYLPGAPFLASGLMSMCALWLFTRRGRRGSARVHAD